MVSNLSTRIGLTAVEMAGKDWSGNGEILDHGYVSFEPSANDNPVLDTPGSIKTSAFPTTENFPKLESR